MTIPLPVSTNENFLRSVTHWQGEKGTLQLLRIITVTEIFVEYLLHVGVFQAPQVILTIIVHDRYCYYIIPILAEETDAQRSHN